MQDGCRLGTDSHADINCVGRHAHILEVFHGRTCNVQPFNDSYAPMKNISTVNACVAHDTKDGQTFILEINQALDFTETMQNSLLCSNQCRAHGVITDDVPIFLDPTGRSTHSIIFEAENISLPLELHGPVSYLPVRYPTEEEIESCQHLELSCGTSIWDPMCLKGINMGVQAFQSICSDGTDEILLLDSLAEDLRRNVIVSAITHTAKGSLSPQLLSKTWRIGLEVAKQTLSATTQEHIRILKGKISRRVRTKAHQSRYNQLGGYLANFASDTFKSKVKSTRGNNYTQLFCNRGNYVKSYPMKSKEDSHHALDRFIHEVGVPREMLTDGAKELIYANWGKICRHHKIHQVTTEPYSPWQNHAELMGGIVKRKVRHLMKTTNTPVRLWDYCWEYVSSITSLTAVDHFLLDGVTPFEKVHGYSPDISEYIDFSWFQWVWYYDPHSPVSDKVQLGRWLGPAHDCGQGLAYHILVSSGHVVTRSTVSIIERDDFDSEENLRRRDDFTKEMESHIGNYCSATIKNCENYNEESPYDSIFEFDDEVDDEEILFQELDSDGNVILKPDVDDFIHNEAPYMESHDNHIGMKVTLPHQGEMLEGTVIERLKNADGTLIGKANDNPILDSREYKVEFGDGSYNEYSANVLIENLYSQVDGEGYTRQILKSITHHRKHDTAVSIENGFVELPSGVRKRKITTKGWDLKIEWEDGTSSWIPLAEVKESNPIEVAEYSVAAEINNEPAFAWWVNTTLKRRDRIIKRVTHRLTKKNLKFGVTIPSSVEEALELDRQNGNTLWKDAIDLELKNVIVAFQLLEDGDKIPAGSKEIPYHFVFDVKFNLTRKARLVAGGHRNKHVKKHNTYSSVASRDSVRICLLLAALNDLDVMMADIGNAYLNAKCKERVHVKCGPELFGREHEGKIAVIVRALYGLKTAGNSWRNHLASVIRDELKYQPTVADPDVYRKAEVTSDRREYYSYLVIYVDDILSITENPKIVLDKLGTIFRLKDGIGEPKLYLGADLRKWDYQRDDGTTGKCWAIGSNSYVKEAVKVAEAQMEKYNLNFTSSRRSGRHTPFSTIEYRPELDHTPLCDDNLANVYQNLIGVLRWLCELGRIDILHEVSILSQYLAEPRIGHLKQVLNIFYYLKYHNRSWMVLDPSRFDVEWNPREEEASPWERARAMKDIYPDAQDSLPHNMPRPRGRAIDISVFVDSDHAGNKVTRRSHTGILIYCNLAPIIWFSKRQNTVETSTFGSEFIALKTATELIEGLMYKLRMFGVPIDGPARVFCDNESVVKSSTYPESSLKRKHCSIAYNKVREAVAAGKLLIYYESTTTNLADLFTKVLSHAKRLPLVQAILS